MAFDLRKYRDENVHWYGDAPLEDVAKDIYERGGEEYHGGRPFEDWSKETGISNQLQKDSEEQQKATIQRQKQEAIANRGFGMGLVSDVAGGLVDYGELGMRAVRAVSPEESWLERKATEGIEGIKKVKEESPFLASPEESPDTGFFSRALHGGVRSAAQSVAASLPSALAGAAMGSAAGPVGTAIGAVAGYALGGATQFGLAQYDDVMERGIKAGKTREEVEPHAIREGLYEGGFEFATDILEGMTMGAGKLLTAPGKQAAKATIRDMMKTSFKDLAKRTGKLAGIETGSEMVTAGAEAEEEHALGLGDQRYFSAAVDAFGPSMVASMIFAGLGHANVKYAQSKIRKTLENPEYTADADKKYLDLSDQLAKTRDPKKAEQLKGELQGLYPQTRAAVIDDVYATLQEYNPTVADVWGQTAYQALREGKAISTQENVMEMQEQKNPSPKGYKLLPPPETSYPAQPYNRPFAAQTAALRETPALPAPERQAWTGADEQFVLGGEYSPYSPEFAELQRRSLPMPEAGRVGPTGTEFTMGGEFSRYSPELAQAVQQKALPVGQEFTMAGPTERYSPDLAEDLKTSRERKRLPEGQGFELRGAPEDVTSPYYPEVAQANLGPWRTKGRQAKLPPSPTSFQTEQESVRQKYEQASTRVKNLSTQMDQYRRQLEKIDPEKSPERRDKILGRIRALQDQIDANRETQKRYETMLGQDITPPATPAPEKSARESAEAFAREAGRVQSPVGKEGLRRKLGQEEKQSWEIERARATQRETEETENEIPTGEFPRRAEIERAAHAAATSPKNAIPQPTEAQKEAGNYQKGHVQLHGMDISIENPAGSERSGVDRSGKPWSTMMQHHYGYIKGTVGKDKDHLDVFIGPKPENGKVYVVDQVDPKTGKFDEHKVLMGFGSEEEARKGYLSNYEKDWKGLGNITGMDVDTFKQWTKEGDQKRPVAGGQGHAPQVIATEKGVELQKGKDQSQVEAMRADIETVKKQAVGTKGFVAPTKIINEHVKLEHDPGYQEYHVRRGKDQNAKTQLARATVRVEKVSGRPITIPGFEGREFFTYKSTVPSGFKTEESHIIADKATGAYLAGYSDLDEAVKRAAAILRSGSYKYLEGLENIRQPMARATEGKPALKQEKRSADSIIEEIGEELSKGGGSSGPTITRLYQELGQAAVPGVRIQDAEETGRLYRMHKDGMVTTAEWDKHVNSLKAEDRILTPKAELAQAMDEAIQDITSIQKETSSGPNKLTAKEVAKEKANVKGVLLKAIKEGEISIGSAVRTTELNELKYILQKKKLLEGKSFEGTPGISATQITDRTNPAIPMYGSYDRIPVAIIAPKELIIGKGQSANEVLLDPNADVTKLRFSLDTQDGIYTLEEIPEVLDRVEAEMKGEAPNDREGEGRVASEKRGREEEPRGALQGQGSGRAPAEGGGVLQTREGEKVAGKEAAPPPIEEPEASFSLKQSTSELRRMVLGAFPGASVIGEEGQRIRFRMPNGSEILVNHGTATLENGAEGAWARVGMDGIMWLSKDLDQEVVHHEAFEAAFDLALNERERKALIEKYGSAHEAAAAYQKWNPEERLDTLFQKVLDFFRKIRQALFPTVEMTFEDVRTGKAWERAVRGAGLERLSGVQLSEVDPQVLNLFGLISEGRKFYADWEKQRLSTADAKRKINQSFIDRAKELGYSEEQAQAILAGFREVNDILNGLDDGLFEESNLDNPIRANADYVKTVDLNTTCPKRFKYASTIGVIQQRLGRPLSQGETTRIAKMLKDRGEEFPCLYCYVESGRGAYNSALIKYIREKDKTLNPRVFVDPLFEVEARKMKGMPERIKKARGYAQAASMSNQPKVYAEYRGQILNMKKALRDEINKRAGLRFFSNTDFQAAHVLDLMQIVADMKMAEMMGHAYTKIPDFVRIFGNSGIKINMSVYGSVKKGVFVPDDKQGMPWKEARALRKEYPNAGTILVVTDPETLEWALDSPDIDMIIPWHRSGMGKETTEKGWLDFTRYQQESWIDPENAPLAKDGKRISAPHVYERYSGLDHEGPGHENSKERYLEIAAKLGVNPKFPNHIDHPGYMKLIRDYARVETPQAVVDPKGVDLDAAKDLILAWAEKSGEEKEPVQSVVDEFLAKNKNAKPVFSLKGRKSEARALQPDLDLDLSDLMPQGTVDAILSGVLPETRGTSNPLLPETGETLEARPKRSPGVPEAVATGRITSKDDFKDVLKYHTKEEQLLKRPTMWVHEGDHGDHYLIAMVNIGNRTTKPYGYYIDSASKREIMDLADQSTERGARYTAYGPLAGFSHYSLSEKGGQRAALPVSGGKHFERVQGHLGKILSRWKNAPEIRAVRHFSDLPPEIRRKLVQQSFRRDERPEDSAQRIALTAQELASNLEGFVYEGKVYLITDNLDSIQRAEQVLAHEVIGHYGIEAVLGDKFDPFLREVVGLYGKKGLREISELYGFDLETEEGRMRAAKEKIAQMAEDFEKPGFLRRLYAAVRDALRRFGFTVAFTDADIHAALTMASDYVEGKRSIFGVPKISKDVESSITSSRKGRKKPPFDEVPIFPRREEPIGLAKLIAEGEKAREAAGEEKATEKPSRLPRLESWKSRLTGEPKRNLQIVFGENGERDLREFNDSFRIPAWLSKTNKLVKSLFDRQNQRDKYRSKLYHDLLDQTRAIFDLDPAKMAEFSKVAFGLENKKVVNARRFIQVGLREIAKGFRQQPVMVPVYQLNADHYNELARYLEDQKVSKSVRDAYVATRKALDQSLIMIWDRLAEIRNIDPTLIEEYRNEIGSIENYFPHNRYGNFHIRAMDPKAKSGEKTKFRMHFNALNETHAQWWANRNIERIREELKKEHPDVKWDSFLWQVDKNRELPEEIYDYPVPVDAMQAIIDSAADRMPDDIRKQIQNALSEEVSNVLKSRGFGAHMIRRKDIPGFEKNDPARVLHDHFAGFAGWLTKMEAAHDFGEILRGIDAIEKPNEYRWGTKFVQDMLQNQMKFDRVVDGARAFFFLKYLGGNLKTAVVNLTQNIISGTPRLAMEVGLGRAGRNLSKAMADMVTTLSREKIEGAAGTKLSKDEARFLKDMFDEGWGQAQLTREVSGKIGGQARKIYDKVSRVMGFPMEIAERFNRMSLGLAAFRAAAAGEITNQKTMEGFNAKLGDKLSYEDAKRFAERVVNDAHFIYGKGNRPAFLRGSAFGKGLSTAYTFRSFSHNLLSMWRWMLTQEGREGQKAFGYSLAGMIALGGLGAAPLYGMIAGLIRQLFGEDPLESGVRKQLPPGMRDLVMYGAPSILGVNIGGSIGMEVPLLDRINVSRSWSEQMGQGMGELLGIPYAVMEEFAQAVDAVKAGRPDRAAEIVSPTLLKNIMSGVRLATEGQTSVTGKPINVPGEKGPRKITEGEAIAKGLGFQPLSSTKAFGIYRTLEELKSYRDEKQAELANRYVAAERKGDRKEMVQVREEAREWNRKAHLENRPEAKINIQDAIEARKKPAQPMKQMRGLSRELREAYGM